MIPHVADGSGGGCDLLWGETGGGDDGLDQVGVDDAGIKTRENRYVTVRGSWNEGSQTGRRNAEEADPPVSNENKSSIAINP